MQNLTRRQLIDLGLALVSLPLAGCGEDKRSFVQRTLFHFDTVCVLGGAMENEVLDEAQDLCDRYEQLFSRTIKTSDVARINAAQGEAVEVDQSTAELIELALGYSEASDGLFDITIGAVTELWDFTKGIVPTEDALAAALPHVGWQQVKVSGTQVRLRDPLARIDLGGIAKGYITDKLMGLFADRGVNDAFVNLGGNVAVRGNNQKGKPWNVGVRDPFDDTAQSVIAQVKTTGGSVVTSGLYERSFTADGRRYWHILDPRTGYPVETDIVSASIFSEDSIDGDGYTKPLFMMDVDQALAFAQDTAGVQALLVGQDGTLHATPNSSFNV